MNKPSSPYSVTLVGAVGLAADQRQAAELRFRMAIEASLGGASFVVPTLQACALARSLLMDLSPGERETADCDAEREVIALWESAEDQAVMAALKPLQAPHHASRGIAVDQARFEISP